jgi:hypothetical protein
LPEIKEIPDEEVRVNDGIFCSEETGALAAEDTGNVKLGVVLFSKDVTGADVTDPKSPKFIFAALVRGTAGETSLRIVMETLSGKYGLLSPEACVVVSVTTGTICELDATLVSTLFVISLAPLAAATAATEGSMLGKDVVTAAVEAIVSLSDDGFFRKSSVGTPRTIQLINTDYITCHTLISFLISLYYTECPQEIFTLLIFCCS